MSGGPSNEKSRTMKRITEKTENDTTFVGMEEVPESAQTDVLILEQFMREDGTVLPRQLTGLCKKQQLRLERCVMQAHWAGLFPDKTIPEFDRSGYKRFNRSASPSVLEFSPNPCPVVPGCKCINNDVTTVECYNIGPDPLAQLVEQYPRLSSLRLIEWTERDFSFDAFSPLKALSKLAVVQSKVHSVFLSTRFPSLTELVLNENAFSDFEQIAYVNGTFNENTHIVDLSRNALRSASGFHKNMLRLNLSYNPLTEAAFPPFSLLQQLDLSGTKFIISPRLNAPKLVEFYMDRSTVEMVDFTQWTLPSLQRLSLLESFSLKFISGRLPKSTKEFSVTSTQLSALPQSFFSESSLRGVNVTATDFDCDPCVFQWSVPISNLIKNQTNCAPVARLANCTLGISQHDPEIVRAEYGQSAILSCTAYGSPQPDIEWWRYRPATYLGTFHPFASDRISATNSW
ncbi:putative ribosomal protein S18 [Ancylostoma ceylanicum]|uniref:Putative ribosomal protein S18 n=1 Tax=Ancylostoma ceylanicum TaxID=53326 RepID=A0A0D6LTR8_9BILA|nr:putative ribosomal protein S18 [Ancylostoma ceylanicum]